MDLTPISNQMKSGITFGWQRIAYAYNHSIIAAVRVAFNALSYLISPIGAHIALGGAAIGLWYLGHSVWNLKEEGPESHDTLAPVLSRIAGIAEMALAAGIVGGLVAIAGGSTALSFGIASSITLVGVFI